MPCIFFNLMHDDDAAILYKYTEKFGIFKYSRDHSASIKVLKQAGVVHYIKSQ